MCVNCITSNAAALDLSPMKTTQMHFLCLKGIRLPKTSRWLAGFFCRTNIRNFCFQQYAAWDRTVKKTPNPQHSWALRHKFVSTVGNIKEHFLKISSAVRGPNKMLLLIALCTPTAQHQIHICKEHCCLAQSSSLSLNIFLCRNQIRLKPANDAWCGVSWLVGF